MKTTPAAISLAAELLIIGTACSTNPHSSGQGLARQNAARPVANATSSPGSPLRPLASPSADTVPQGLPTPAVALVSTDLDFGGSISGRVQGQQARGSCGRFQDTFAVNIQFAIAGQPFILEIQIFSYRSPGDFSIPPERVSIHTPTGPTAGRFLPALSGRVIVDEGEHSGRIQATLVEGSGAMATVDGTWNCYPPPR